MTAKKMSTRTGAPNETTENYNTILDTMSSDCQVRRVLEHMMRYGSITQADAVSLYNIYRLSARISDLREAGIDIRTDLEANKGRGYHARYFLES